jgi:hypothetical protein
MTAYKVSNEIDKVSESDDLNGLQRFNFATIQCVIKRVGPMSHPIEVSYTSDR